MMLTETWKAASDRDKTLFFPNPMTLMFMYLLILINLYFPATH